MLNGPTVHFFFLQFIVTATHFVIARARQVCTDDKVCILAFLPDIYDSGKDGRNAYLETFGGVANKNRRLFNYMWAAGGSQPALEEQLGLTFGFPAVAAVHRGKNL